MIEDNDIKCYGYVIEVSYNGIYWLTHSNHKIYQTEFIANKALEEIMKSKYNKDRILFSRITPLYTISKKMQRRYLLNEIIKKE